MSKKEIFISHSTKDKEVADMIADFLHNVGIDKELIFCSSLPGNDVIEKIPDEVRMHLNENKVNIVILSNNYYQSAYCLNEAGIIWCENNKKAILIALPEINTNNMVGFLDKNYLLHDLNSEKDILSIYDTVIEELKYFNNAKVTTINNEKIKLRTRYTIYLKNRVIAVTNKPDNENVTDDNFEEFNFSTDDEKVLIYCICKKNKRKISKKEFKQWLQEHEIYSIDVNNAFDLMNVKKYANISNGTLSIDIDNFERLIYDSNKILSNYEEVIIKHTKKSVDTFKELWDFDRLDYEVKLFCAYITDEKITKFKWERSCDEQVKDIVEWERKETLFPRLSNKYKSCLRFFISNNLVYESNQDFDGKISEYSLCETIKQYLCNCPVDIKTTLNNLKLENFNDVPFY